MLTIQHLSKTYPRGNVRALHNITMQVQRGEFLAVIGLSGSGKSTLLRCINRLVEPTSGTICFNDQDVTRLHGRELRMFRRQFGMIFQQFNLIRRSSVLTNVLCGRLAYTPSWKALFNQFTPADIDLARQNLARVGLEDKIYQRADQLSGGQQQRVAIARALMQQPQCMLADEPVASLDPALSHSVLSYLEQINQQDGITIICNLHFLDLVRRYATRAIALKDGEIVYEGAADGIDDRRFKEIYGKDAVRVEID